MVSPNSPLVVYLEEFFETHNASDFVLLIQHFALKVLLPLAMALLAFGGSLQLVCQLWQYVVPPSESTRYEEAKQWYHQGKVSAALNEWSRLERCGPAYLSRACHAIYVDGQPTQGMQILQDAKVNGVNSNKQQLEGMALDAQAILDGNTVMVHLNAPLVKEEYLGLLPTFA